MVDFREKITKSHKTNAKAAWPHNFQAVNSPDGRLFLIGGGDYKEDKKELYECHELMPNNAFNMVKRADMNHPRHGHCAIWFGEKFVVVTGSRKEKNKSEVKCEMYNADIDVWWELPDLNVGRHYHSSCAFNERYVYVFCGISN